MHGIRGSEGAWKIPLLCLVFGVVGLLLALATWERHTKAVDVLKTWTKVEGIVTRTEQREVRQRRGGTHYINSATVTFLGTDRKRKEGILFEQHAPGAAVTVYYDPQKDYSPGAPVENGARQLESPSSIEYNTSSNRSLTSVIALLVGFILSCVGAYHLVKLFSAKKGQAG